MAHDGQDIALRSVRLGMLILSLQLVPALSSGGAHAFEWGGIFATPEDTYLWTAQKVKSGNTVSYGPDLGMKMVVLAASEATEAKLHDLESAGETNIQLASCEQVNSGGTIKPKANHCYNIVFKQDWWQSLYTIDASGQSALAFFTEHLPTEFENTAHYLKDDHGDDIEPVAELPEEDHAAAPAPTPAPEEKKYWGEGILVSVIVNLVTLAGVIFMVPGLKTLAEKYKEEFECVVSSFAAGAISACAFFILLFESTHLIAVEYTEEEVDVSWRWGTMILSGALFPTLVHAIVEIATKPSPKGSDAEKGNELAIPLAVSRPRLISSVLIGDFMHNMCDGFFIGNAFKVCGKSTGWTVAWGTVGHEIAQELGDYLVLTGKDCQLHPAVALVLNFLSGTGILIGCLIALAAPIEDVDIGLILAFGGGVYLNIAFIECMGRFQTAKVAGLVRAFGIFLFMFGAAAIGLILVWHEHCIPPLPVGVTPKPGGHHHR